MTAQRRLSLSHDRVIAAAIKIADAQGVEAVTMRRLAEELEVHPTSMYNHVLNKSAILDGIADALIVEANPPTAFDSWKDWVRTFAAGLRSVARAHPGAFLVLTQRAATGPVAAKVAEAALDAFRRAGFSAGRAAQAVTGISLALLGVALNECPPTAPFVEPDLSHLSAEEFPRIHQAWAAATRDDGVWDLVVEGLIVGVSALGSELDPTTSEGAMSLSD